MADYQTISVGFGPGVDTKTDPKASSKPIVLQDCIFTNPHRITKRNGYDLSTMNIIGGGTISNPLMIRNYKNELTCAGTASGATGQNVQSAMPAESGTPINGFQGVPLQGQRLFSYSESLNGWADRGKYTSVKVSKQLISGQDLIGLNASGGATDQSCAILGNIALFCCAYVNPSQITSYSQIQITVVDQSTGTQLVSNFAITNATSLPRAILLGASVLAITYINAGGALASRVITVTEMGGVVIGSEVSIASSIIIYDIVNTSSGATLVYSTASATSVAVLDTTGTQINSNIASSNPAVQLSVCIGSTGNVWAYWWEGSPGSQTLYYSVFNATVSSQILVKTSIFTTSITPGQISSFNNSSTQQSVYWSIYATSGGNSIPTIFVNVVTQTGTVVPKVTFLENVDVYSKITTLGGLNYMAVVFLSALSPTGFIVDLNDAYAVAKFLPDQAQGLSVQSLNVLNSSFVNPLISISPTQLFLCAGYISSLFTISNTSADGPVESIGSIVYGMCGLTFDFNHIDSYQSIIQQDTLLLNGGVVSQYDSRQLTELGFSINPDGVLCTPSASGGHGGSGSWIYYVTYEWFDSLGNLHQSAPSLGFLIVFASGSSNEVTISVQTLSMSQKQNVVIAFWRTKSAGAIGFRIGSIANNPGTNVVTLVDNFQSGILDDATIAGNQQLYTQGGAILENIAPPPSMILWTNNNRAWCIDSENPETTIEYSKTASQGSGVAFSTGQLELVIDSKYGAITGVSPMDEKTAILKQNGAGYFYGDGANDSGTGSTISSFQFIPSDTGCVNSKSVILYPNGILFKSPKGIYILSRGVQISYFGTDVEKYNSQDVQSAQLLSSKNQIRFLTSSGSSLLYDYVMNQWSAFTNHAGYSADVWNGNYVYARSGTNNQDNNSIFIEDTTSFLDNTTAISPAIQIQFVKGQSIQNYERLRRVALLGDYQNGSSSGHGVQISAAYDFGSTFSQPVPYYFGSASSSGVFQYRERLARQKCDTVSLLIQEITTGASGEYIDFTDLGFELAVKKGLNKLPGFRSVG